MKGAIHLGDGLYQFRSHYYRRIRTAKGTRSWRAIDAPNRKQAKAEMFRLREGRSESSLTIGEAIRAYHAADCPDKKRNPRIAKYLVPEQKRCLTLLQFFDRMKCCELTASTVDEYADWRMRKAEWGYGGRAADLDVVTLRNALRWAARCGDIRTNPFETITVSSYRKPAIKHCREDAPRSGDELHDIAAHFFESRKVDTQTLGWLTLLTAGIGCRISEMLALRIDADLGEPGHRSNGVLSLRRAKKGANNFFRLQPHPHIRKCLKEFFAWRSGIKKLNGSPWWFPGRNPSRPILESTLTHALKRVGELSDVNRTAHGLRSFYVTCRRSAGLSDAEIALETGQISGGREIVRTYGEARPEKVRWMPKDGKPAWAEIRPELDHSTSGKIPVKKVVNVDFAYKNRVKLG